MIDVEEIYRQACRLGVCPKMTGKESAEELIQLFFSPQGVEFCQKNNFPTMDMLRSFRSEQARAKGAYVDAGEVRICNVERVALIGDTEAELTYTDPTKRHVVILMHGAKAHIKASGYAVVFVYNGDGCEVVKTQEDYARIL